MLRETSRVLSSAEPATSEPPASPFTLHQLSWSPYSIARGPMAPQPQTSPPPIPPPVPVETHPNRAGGLKPPLPQRVPPDPTRLAPEHAYYPHSQPRSWHDSSAQHRPIGGVVSTSSSVAVAALRPPPAVPGFETRKPDARKSRDRRRKKRKGAWKKLMWVRQTYPDNYTDAETFLDHLQRNPRLRPYDFWPLVADSTVIVQHVCSVVIFVCCFVEIVQNRVSPVSVVGWGSIGTVLGWVLWDSWVWKEQSEAIKAAQIIEGAELDDGSSASSASSNPGASTSQSSSNVSNVHGLGLNIPRSSSEMHLRRRSTELSTASLQSANPNSPTLQPTNIFYTCKEDGKSLLSTRNRQRLATVKSAVLIYCALLGLSPILKSLTKSTASDSIWALSCWLMIINIFSFDYGSGEGGMDATKFPASLSTNAALMASTVLASRLPSTTHVFSLTLFSIEVFGLFPVFRRHLKHVSWTGHLILTFGLVFAAGAGVGITLRGGWAAAIVGSFLGSILTALVMGSCSWWLLVCHSAVSLRYVIYVDEWDRANLPSTEVTSGSTHAIMAFAESETFNNDGQFTPWGNVQYFRSPFLKDTEFMVSIGGWGDITGFSNAIKSKASIQNYAENVAAMITSIGVESVGGQYYFDTIAHIFWMWDTPQLMQRKFTDIVNKLKMGGVMAWSLGEDSYDWSHVNVLKAQVRMRA
ncbi:Putative phosphatidylinositol N-acetylglucosaminyltransferase subunit C [Talaromyces islandicus]|uniref:Putative phosphatidylinositol N-acetylglucosaminyltransferase subunit C n=1 Tax=Talaromyces islandicus TaxID=28573 RepID=A0A0U1LIJ0_TALIS|nr:Putative phosphatidylinositol N-acetylglucosaminyltransferase subunit C [Talaromyces islandicus]